MPVHFFNKIIYSAANEDSNSERKALGLHDKDVVLCITGSGARPLDLLADQPQKIVSVDFNAHQNHLLQLKIAGYKTLDYSQFIQFVGLVGCSDRLYYYKKINALLPTDSRQYWDAKTALIQRGILYCGQWEKWLKLLAWVAHLRGSKLDQLLAFSAIDEQKEYWQQHWSDATWKWMLQIVSNRFAWKYLLREPGALLIPREFSIWQYLYQRLEHLGAHFLISKNAFAQLLFCGRYLPGAELPVHLRAEYFDIIKAQVDTIEIVHQPLCDFLESTREKISAFSLSDFSSYADAGEYLRTWSAVIKAAAPGARFCERQFLVTRQPENNFPQIHRNTELEQLLEQTDETFVYSFCAGKLRQ